MIVGRDFVFVLNPKTASTSIMAALLPYGVSTATRHEPLTRKPPQRIVAAVRRDTTDRLKSGWRQKTRMSVPFDEWLGGEAWMMDRMADFKRTTQDYWINEHVNTVLSFENLAEDWRSFCGLIGIEAELLHLNKGNYNGD